MDPKNKFYVTTPIYYATAKPHLGSLYSTLIADVTARWHKLLGKKVFFLTGTDEHGQKIEQAAAKAGMKPKEFVDSFIDDYKKMWQQYELDYTYFIRTSDNAHVKAVQEWLQVLLDKGDIYKGFYKGWYCVPCENFVSELKQENEPAPSCLTCGRSTTLISEESYFFKLSKYQDTLLAFYKEHSDFIFPKERINEVISFVKSGLRDLSISRTTVKWGVPFPNDKAHVAYVWADALNNYITAIGYGQEAKQKEFNFWWPADLQVMGKDILRFHAIYWPAFLMASELPLPKHLLVHGWIKIGAQKMSKSLGNVVDPEVLYNLYGAEPVRYYLMRYMTITQDTEFRITALEQALNSDLANDLGNLLNRMTMLAEKYNVFEIKPPEIWSEKGIDLRDRCWNMIEDMEQEMNEYVFHMALSKVWKFIGEVNTYFHAQEPWKLAKEDPDKFKEVISATAHSLRVIALLLWPIMPQKMEQLLRSLGVSFSIELGKNQIEQLKNEPWHHTFMLQKIPTLFEKKDVAAEAFKTKI